MTANHMHANWSFPTSVRFGAGRINELAESARAVGMSRPLVVTDRGLADSTIVAQALAVLAADGLEASLFSGVDPNPTDHNLEAGIAAFISGDHDGVVAMGGGSALDLGKLVAFMCEQTRSVWDFEDIGDSWTRADANVIAPIVAIPTTAGTGSEVGRAGVLTNSATQVKKIIFHPKALPAIVIGDPVLTVSMPTDITVGTGMDALIHCLEAYCTPSYHPLAQGIALEGMRLVLENLPKVHAQPDDIEARGHMMSAAAMGATAFQKGLGGIHALSHPVGARHHTHHGTTNAVVMPVVLAHNRDVIAERLGAAAAYIGIGQDYDAFVAHIMSMRAALGVPDTLTALGVKDPDIPVLAKDALGDPTADANPVPLTLESITRLYEQCL